MYQAKSEGRGIKARKSSSISFTLHPGEGAGFPLWRWRRCKAPKTSYFQCCCYPMIPYLCWLSLLSPKDPTLFWWNVGPLITLTQRPPTFCIQLPQEATFYNFINNLRSFLPFSTIFFLQIPAFKALTKKSKVTFSPNICTLILNQNLASHPMTPIFF